MDKYEKLDEILNQLILDLDSIGFDINGDKVGDSIVLEIIEKEYSREDFEFGINGKDEFN